MQTPSPHWPENIVEQLNQWGHALGFSQIGVAGVDLSHAEPGLLAWLEEGCHGGMAYMAKHGTARARPHELVPATVRVITARMNYLPDLQMGAGTATAAPLEQGGVGVDVGALSDDWRAIAWADMNKLGSAYVSVYARGRDYHKVMRGRLQQLATQLQTLIGPYGYRVFTDSAPVLEAELATMSGQGWRGKHSLVLNREAGSMFFLGEIFVDVALPITEPTTDHCGQCTSCMDVCPTQAIVAPYKVDARRCISYLTIEHEGAIDERLRSAMGNRIYGCDDCQLTCPWNKFAQVAPVPDFAVRQALDAPTLLQLWAWDEATFLRLTEGSAIRRIGHARWLRNVATAMGNALAELSLLPALSEVSGSPDLAVDLMRALAQHSDHPNAAVREHVEWALQQYHQR
jgi:epoxyqueuosine reductase